MQKNFGYKALLVIAIGGIVGALAPFTISDLTMIEYLRD